MLPLFQTSLSKFVKISIAFGRLFCYNLDNHDLRATPDGGGRSAPERAHGRFKTGGNGEFRRFSIAIFRIRDKKEEKSRRARRRMQED